VDKFGNYISLVLEGVCTCNGRKKELEEEIRDHLEIAKKELIDDGYTEEQSELMAIQRFGEVEDIKMRFKSVFTPYKRFKDIVNEKKLLKESFRWTVSIIGAFIIAISIRSYAFAATEIKQCSMQNTLFEGQRLIESKIAYYYSEPKRGDIVVINEESEEGIFNVFIANSKEFFEGFYRREENDKKRLIKRVIGVPGDKIDIKDGKIYLNGQRYHESYIKGDTFPKDMKFPVTVPEKEYFVLGDNRESSMDSRDIGFINIDKIEGEAVFRLWPLDKLGIIHN